MPNGYSLHIGLNQVDPRYYNGCDGKLECCVEDAEAMLGVARHYGYDSLPIMINENATREKVKAALEAYAQTLEPGDILFLTYSGHGGVLPDLNRDEPDLQDETWCLYNGHLVDDELHKLYAKFAEGVRIFVVSDSCHSGTVVKGGPEERGGAVIETINRDSLKPRMISRDICMASYSNSKQFYDEILTQPFTDFSDIDASVLLIAACQDDQKAYEPLSGNGILTSRLLQFWDNGNFNGTYKSLYENILGMMPEYQTPNFYQTGKAFPNFAEQKPFSI